MEEKLSLLSSMAWKRLHPYSYDRLIPQNSMSSNFVMYLILGIIVALAVFIGYIIFIMYAVALGIGYKNETEANAWDYWERMKSKRWDELTEEEQEKMIIANLIIANDVGAVVTKEQLVKMLDEQLPITEPHTGLSYPMGC